METKIQNCSTVKVQVSEDSPGHYNQGTSIKKTPTQTKGKTTNKQIKNPNYIKVTQRVVMAVADKV